MLRVLAAVLLVTGCQKAKSAPDAGDPYARLSKLHPPLPKPKAGEWRERFNEAPQSFGQYRDVAWKPAPGRDVLYVVVIGDLEPAQELAIAQSEKLLALYFGGKVKRLPPVTKQSIPERALRNHPRTGQRQLYTVWVLEELLPPLKPRDTLALVAFTAEDLFPDPEWNFVFGQASPAGHVGIWSLARFGDPATEAELVLRRTVKTAAHETAHAFGLLHCTESLCVMNGANSLEESDRSPLEPCPICLKKLQWTFGFDVRQRFERLCAFHSDAGLTEEEAECRASLSALQ